MPEETTDIPDPNAPTTVPMATFVAMRNKLQAKATAAQKEATAANTRYEVAAQANVAQLATHKQALADQQHGFDTVRAFDSIGAGGEGAESDRGYMEWNYKQLEPSVPDGAPEGTEPSKPPLGEWLATFVKGSTAMAAYRPAADAAPKTALDAARAAAGAVKRNTVLDPAARVVQDAGGDAEAPTDEAAYGRMDNDQKRAHLESLGLEPRQSAEA